MKIRQAAPDEWVVLKKLNSELFEHDYEFDNYLNLNWPNTKSGIQYYKKSVQDSNRIAFVADSGEEVVGYLTGYLPKTPSYLKKGTKIAELGTMYIKEDFRRKGIGGKLFKALEEWATQKGCDAIEVRTYCKNENAINFYQKVGFRKEGLILGKVLK